jgi:triacylglycerol lipase
VSLHPIILHHGLFGYDSIRLGPLTIPHFPGVEDCLRVSGRTVLCARTHPVASIARRAEELKTFILNHLDQPGVSSPLILVAHSMGGLDARYMITHLGMSQHVAALLTIATPHRGASLADFWHLHLGKRLPVYDFLTRLGLDIGAVYDLTRSAMSRFNEQTPDHPDVRYYSIPCAAPPSVIRPRLIPSHHLIQKEEGSNDGIVSAASAVWGNELPTWPVDHITAINRNSLFTPKKLHTDVAAKYAEAISLVEDSLQEKHEIRSSKSETMSQ